MDSVSNPGGGTPFVVITSWANVCSLGTFDVTFNNDHVTGSFNATNCDNGADAGQSCVN